MIRYQRNSKTISGRLHDEMVMMDIDQGKYFSLNQSATAIWEHLEKPLTVEDLCGILTVEFEIDQAQCRKEVEEHLDEMVKIGLVHEIKD